MRFKRGVQPEVNLIKRAKSGDTEAFNSLHRIYLNAIFRYIFFSINDVKKAQELTQQVFLKAWEGLPAYHEQGHPFSTWLYRIANVTIAEYHPVKNESRVVKTETSVKPFIDPGWVLRRISQSQDTDILARAISQLQPEQKQVVILRYIEGLNNAEISHLLAKQAGVCRKLEYHALSSLNHILSESR